MLLYHTFDPVYDADSKVLILGTFPSVKSREEGFYYGNPHNRFWRVLAEITANKIPVNIAEKKIMLHNSGIALWDVIKSCEITGSSDSGIKNAVPNNINKIICGSGITKIFANGRTAEKLYDLFLLAETGINITALPSTSPANASYTIERLIEKWKIIIP